MHAQHVPVFHHPAGEELTLTLFEAVVCGLLGSLRREGAAEGLDFLAACLAPFLEVAGLSSLVFWGGFCSGGHFDNGTVCTFLEAAGRVLYASRGC